MDPVTYAATIAMILDDQQDLSDASLLTESVALGSVPQSKAPTNR